ncbi:MAG: hypothetical protein JWL92_304 [Candidatus Nomurabacteria bacterium]|nr:hypothetical protein [Candidatus Nomurabacteria bacterium]
MKKLLISLVLLVYLSGTLALAKDLTSSHFIVRDPSIGTGGGYQSSGSFKMYSAGNLNVSGNGGTSTSFKARDGFLQYPEVHSGIVSANATGSTIAVTWTASTAQNGFTVSGYKVGIATASGGPYTLTTVGNVLGYSYTTQTPGDYFIVLQTLDALGNVIAVSNEVTVTVQSTFSFSLSSSTIGFGTLAAAVSRFATSDGAGTNVEPSASHTMSVETTSSSGYNVTLSGSTLASGVNTINAIPGVVPVPLAPGSEQFGVRTTLGSGTGTIAPPYNGTASNYGFGTSPLNSQLFVSTSAPSAQAVYNVDYAANIAASTEAGSYVTTLTYVATTNF